MAYETIKCSVCGHEVHQIGVGRPRHFHPDCRKLDQLLTWAEDQLVKIDFTDQKSRDLRSRLWSLANLLNSKNTQQEAA